MLCSLECDIMEITSYGSEVSRMLFRGNVVCFDVEKITSAIMRAFQNSHFSDRDMPLHEMIEIMVKAACGDPEAKETWEEHCFKRDEELKRSIELRKINSLFELFPGNRKKSDEAKIKARINANKRRLEQLSQRQPQGDGKTIRQAAMMPIPPMITKRGGQFYTQGIGV